MTDKAILFTNKVSGEKTIVQAKNLGRARARILQDLYEVSMPSAGQAIKLVQEGTHVIFDEDAPSNKDEKGAGTDPTDITRVTPADTSTSAGATMETAAA